MQSRISRIIYIHVIMKICWISGGIFSMYILYLVQNYIVLLFYNNIEIGNLNDPKESTFHMPLKASV